MCVFGISDDDLLEESGGVGSRSLSQRGVGSVLRYVEDELKGMKQVFL